MLRQWRRQHFLELLECRRKVGVVLVGVAHHETGRQDDGHRLRQGQLQGRQELFPDDAPLAALRPHGDADLLVDGPQVSVDGPWRDIDALCDVGRSDPLGVTAQDGDDADEPGEPVAFRRISAGLVLEGHGDGG